MYLAAILLYVGFWVTTLSLLTLIPMLATFIGYNYLASAEEQILTEKFGNEYIEYKKKVRKWIP
jgi:protein-S-isoprenylcysteine O-methyltransferase Ste14